MLQHLEMDSIFHDHPNKWDTYISKRAILHINLLHLIVDTCSRVIYITRELTLKRIIAWELCEYNFSNMTEWSIETIDAGV